jgi:sterol desaturase/sphingolipid hydroxylase (fatty acid hydroxylase superfamily)
MLSVGMIFAAFLFRGGRMNAVIFWLFLINGVLNALYIFEPFVGLGGPPIVLALFNYTVPVATALVALQLHRRRSAIAKGR